MSACRAADAHGAAAQSHSSEDAGWLLESRPDVVEAIRRRLAEHPEYRIWLQSFGAGVLKAVDGAP